MLPASACCSSFLFSLVISRILKSADYFPIKAIFAQIRLGDPHLVHTPAIGICAPSVEENIAGEFVRINEILVFMQLPLNFRCIIHNNALLYIHPSDALIGFQGRGMGGW